MSKLPVNVPRGNAYKTNCNFLISNYFKTQEMCPWDLFYVPIYFKSQNKCNAAVDKDSYPLQYFPDWFVKL